MSIDPVDLSCRSERDWTAKAIIHRIRNLSTSSSLLVLLIVSLLGFLVFVVKGLLGTSLALATVRLDLRLKLRFKLGLRFGLPEVVTAHDLGAGEPLDGRAGDIKLTLVDHQRCNDGRDTNLDDVKVVGEHALTLDAHGEVSVEAGSELTSEIGRTALVKTGVDVLTAKLVVVGTIL